MRDGYAKLYQSNYAIEIWQNNREWLEYIQRILLNEFEIDTPIKLNKGGYRLKFRSVKFWKWLISEGFPKDGNHAYWETPKSIRTDQAIRYYAAGFFDAEGGFGSYRHGKHEYWRVDYYHSWNIENFCPPLNDIKTLLERINIHSGRVRPRKSNNMENYPRYVLSISGQGSVKRFAQLIPIHHPDKAKIAASLAQA